MKSATLHWLATFLVFLGALNWGLVGVFDYNIISAVLGNATLIKVAYVLVGLSAVYFAFTSSGLFGKK